jgi:hypothetical protein
VRIDRLLGAKKLPGWLHLCIANGEKKLHVTAASAR